MGAPGSGGGRRLSSPGALKPKRWGAGARSLLSGVRAGAAAAAKRYRAQPPRVRLLFGAIAVWLVLAPVALTLAREDRYEAEVEIFPDRAGPYPAPAGSDYYEELYEQPSIRDAALALAGVRSSPELLDETEIAESPESRVTYLIRVRADTPEHAADLATSLANLTAQASADDVREQAEEEIEAIAGERADAELSAAESARVQTLRDLSRNPSPRFVLGPRPDPPAVEGTADEIVDALPGGFTAAPSPVWAGLAGLLLAAAVWTVWLVRAKPRRRRAPKKAPAQAGAQAQKSP